MTPEQTLALLLTRSVGRGAVWDILKMGQSASMRTAADLLAALSEAAKTNSRIVLPSIDDLRANLDQACHATDLAEQHGVRVLTATDDRFPATLKDIPTAPVILFAKGNIECLSATQTVAIIGTRQPTDYGFRSGKRFGEVFAEAGFTVVSGLATGCDTAAHKGCLAVRGRTVAILAHGLDMVFPKENQGLAEEIVSSGGLLLSEYPIGTRSMPHNFIERDRLQSGLSLGVLVIETGIKGGTMHTVEFCRKQNRVLGCFQPPPGHDAPSTAGNRMLIDERGAFPIATKADLEAFMKRLRQPNSDSMTRPPTKSDPSGPGQLPLFPD